MDYWSRRGRRKKNTGASFALTSGMPLEPMHSAMSLLLLKTQWHLEERQGKTASHRVNSNGAQSKKVKNNAFTLTRPLRCRFTEATVSLSNGHCWSHRWLLWIISFVDTFCATFSRAATFRLSLWRATPAGDGYTGDVTIVSLTDVSSVTVDRSWMLLPL